MTNLLGRLFGVAAVLVCSTAGLAQDPPPGITLTQKSLTARAKKVTLRLEGTAPLLDETMIKLTFRPQIESGTMTKFEPTPVEGNTTQAEVRGKKFRVDQELGVAGLYKVTVEALPYLQPNKAAREALMKWEMSNRKFEFVFSAWTDDLMTQANSQLSELIGIADEAHDLVSRIERACASQEAWGAQSKALLQEVGKLGSKLDRNPPPANLFSAAHFLVRATIGDLEKHGAYFVFVNGKWSRVKDYHETEGEGKDFRQETFNFGNLKKYLKQAPWYAGRELVLWAIKDLRRTEGVPSSALKDTIKSYAGRPGVAEFAERLQKATLAELDALEKDARIVAVTEVKNDKGGK